MTLTYLFSCSVCEGEFVSKSKWLQHLTSDKHQVLARKECLKNWSDSKIKECCVLLFSSFPLTSGLPEEDGADDDNHGVVGGGDDHILQHFSNDLGKIVTDYVFWKSRPFWGILQFESKDEVDQLMSALGSPAELTIHKGRIQLRRAVELMDLEWMALLPGKIASRYRKEGAKTADSETIPNGDPSIVNVNEHNEEDFDCVVVEAEPSSLKRPLTVDLTSPERPSSKKQKQRSAPPPPVFSVSTASLQSQFADIISSVKVPDNEFQNALETVAALKDLLHSKYPLAEVTMFRYWFLQLRNSIILESKVNIFVSNSTPDQSSSIPIEADRIQEILHSDASNFQLHVSDASPKSSNVNGKSKIFWKATFLQKKFQFRLLTDVKYLMEVQACRLAEYLCRFDSRSHFLMTLVYYWASVNSLKFGQTISFEESYRYLPEPITLQWLVIFFLCHTQRIPTAKDIQDRPREMFIDQWTGRDIGFEEDPEYVQEWKSSRRPQEEQLDDATEQFLLTVLKLFQEFLHFYSGTLDEMEGSFILNTRNGEKMKINGFLGWDRQSGPRLEALASLKERISADQLELNRSNLAEEKLDLDQEASSLYKSILKSRKKGFHLTHPFNLAWSISVPKSMRKVLNKMKVTGRKLAEYLAFGEENGTEQACKTLGPLTKTLTVS